MQTNNQFISFGKIRLDVINNEFDMLANALFVKRSLF